MSEPMTAQEAIRASRYRLERVDRIEQKLDWLHWALKEMMLSQPYLRFVRHGDPDPNPEPRWPE